jgi:predicted esterase
MWDETRAKLLWITYLVCLGVASSCSSPSEPSQVPDRPTPCLSGTALCAERVDLGSGLYLPIHSTHLLEHGNGAIKRAIIVVHGSGRNGNDYFERTIAPAAAMDLLEETLIIAPTFQTSEDGPSEDEPFWTSGGWKRGHLSSSSGPSPRVSSYTAIDRILELVLDSERFPILEQIVVTGHSAGGQVAHRFAGTSRIENETTVPFRYVVANPSTYLYIGSERDSQVGFAIPNSSACADYDDWHYGLQDLNSYATAVSPDSIKVQLVRRDVRILIGSADSLSASLDVTCGANMQGRHRFERGQTLIRFMDGFHSGHGHQEMIVPGTGHSSTQMYISAEGRRALFGG